MRLLEKALKCKPQFEDYTEKKYKLHTRLEAQSRKMDTRTHKHKVHPSLQPTSIIQLKG